LLMTEILVLLVPLLVPLFSVFATIGV